MSELLRGIFAFLATLFKKAPDSDVEDTTADVNQEPDVPEPEKEPDTPVPPPQPPGLALDPNEDVSLVVADIKQHNLPSSQYYRAEYPKKQIYVHHTASGADPYGVIDYWNSNSTRVGTFLVIGGKPTSASSRWYDGEMVQCFWSGHWCHHLGISLSGNRVPSKYKTSAHNGIINKQSIGIEICAWGPLTLKNGQFYNYVDRIVNENEVVEYSDGYRGFNYYHKYTNAQMESLYRSLRYLCDKYDIPTIAQDDIFDISTDALSGKPGIYTHTSVRSDKTDCHPQPELIEVLNAL